MTRLRLPGATSLASKAGTLMVSLLDEQLRECLRRCAVPPAFDETTYERLLRPKDGPSLEMLGTIGQLEHAPGEPDRYRLVPLLRDVCLGDWWTAADQGPAMVPPVPAELRQLAGQLADLAKRQSRPLEELDLRLVQDPAAAEELFRTIYDAADRRHDLGRCRAILDVLDSTTRRSILDARLVALRAEYATYLAARAMWAGDFYRSATYTRREAAETVLEELLDGRHARILQLCAPDGLGKSMQLQWFIARRCVPARLPCARLDFDHEVNPVTASRHPWLLLLEAAAQLDQQITGLPFQELLAAYGHYRTLLLGKPAAEELGTAPRHASKGEGEDVGERFVAALSGMLAGRQAVVVLDSFEKVLHGSIDPSGIVTLLTDVVERVPALRVVLASLVELADRIPADRLPQMASHRLAPLTAEQQRHYLVDIRGVDEDAAGEIQKLTEGRPLTLATYADLVLRYQLTAAELATWREPGLLAAILHFVDEVDDDRVRWLLRYGVIPRRLRYDFVVSVMQPFLADGMAGTATWDDPAKDKWSPKRNRTTFRTDLEPPSDEHELRELWNTLVDDATDYGWITLVHDEPDTLQIRRDVVRPLRELIRPHPVYAALQRAAGDYFQRRAEEDRDRWVTWMQEAIFHRFQHDASAGFECWRAAIGQAREEGRYGRCLDLATGLLGEDYVKRSGTPIPPMTYEVLAAAHLERARAAADLADQNLLADQNQAGVADPLWSEVEAGLGAARDLARTHPEVRLPSLAVVIEGRLALARGNAKEAEALLRDCHDKLQPSSELADLERGLGQALLRSGAGDAAEHLMESYQVALGSKDTPGARQSVFALLHAHADTHDYGAAMRVVEEARRDGVAKDDDRDLGLAEAWILAEAGAVARARDLVRRLRLHEAGDSEAQLILAWVNYRADDLAGTVAAAERSLSLAEQKPSRAIDDVSIALALRGLAFAGLLAADRSAADLTAAASRARELREYNGAAEYAGWAAVVLTDLTGELSEAAQLLDEAERSGPRLGSDGWLRTRLALARLQRALGEPTAEATLREALDTAEHLASPPGDLVEVIVDILAVTPAAHQQLAGRLVECLERITPAPARLHRVARLRDVPSLVAPPALLERLRVLLVDEPERADIGGDPSPPDRTVLRWRSAEALRVVGRPGEARSMLDSALTGRDDALGWWWWLDGMTRLGAPSPDEPTPPDKVLVAAPRMVSIACQVTLAERRLHLDPPDRIAKWLEAAAALLKGMRPNQWSARLAAISAELAQLRDEEGRARRHAAEAADVYGRLGDLVNRDAMAGRFGLGGEEQREDASTIELRFGAVSGRLLAITARPPDGDPIDRSVPTSEFGDVEDSTQTLLALRTVLWPLIHGWRAWSEEVAEHLLWPELRAVLAVADGPPRDLRLVLHGREPAVLPWELTRAWETDVPVVQAPAARFVYRSLKRSRQEEAKTRALQQALRRLEYFPLVSDGLSGAFTDQAVQEFQRAAGLGVSGHAGPETWSALRRQILRDVPRRPLRAVVLRPGRDREAERQRGYATAGRDPVAAYLQHGIELAVVEDPQTDTLAQAAEPFKDGIPDLLHVMSPVKLIGGATVLDFGADAGWRRSRHDDPDRNTLSVRALGDLCSALGRGAKLPLVILDIPLPPSPLEAVRNLGIRNSFAYQLLKLGVAETVLAMGLAEPTDQAQILDQIVSGLAQDQDVAAVARRLQRARSPGDLISTLPYAASALFLERPPSSLLPLGY
jgi:hypothetical protein